MELLEVMRQQFEAKGKELQLYKEENKIKIVGEEERAGQSDCKSEAPSSGVLVT